MLRYSTTLLSLCIAALTFGQSQFSRFFDRGEKALLEGNIPEAKLYLERALKIMPAEVSIEEKSVLYNNLGVLSYQTGEYKKGIEWYTAELAIYRKIGNDSLIAGSLHNLGLAYKEIGLYKKAMEQLVTSARIRKRLNKLQQLSSTWNAMGSIQLDLHDFDKALTYYQQSLQLRESIGYQQGVAVSYNNIGEVHLELKHYTKAEVYLLEALRRKSKLDNKPNLINTLISLGKLYTTTGDSKQAYKYLVEAYEIAETIGNSDKVASSICYLAVYYASTGEKEKATSLFHQAQNSARASSDWKLLRDALTGEIALLESGSSSAIIVGKYKELLDTKEKIRQELNAKEIARLEIQYDVGRKNDEIRLRRKQASIDHLQKQRLTGWLVAVAGLAIGIAVALYYARRSKKKIESQKNEIQDLHHELSHRTKNYFSLLSGILRSDKNKAANDEVKRVLEININRLDAMSMVQGYLLANTGHARNSVQLDKYLNHLTDTLLFNLFPGENSLNIIRDLDIIFLDYDKSMRIAIVLNELICNAIEHGLPHIQHPVLSISLKQEKNEVMLIVRDNGQGIPVESIQSGSVKGRDLIRKLLHKIDGEITYRNDNGCVAQLVIKL